MIAQLNRPTSTATTELDGLMWSLLAILALGVLITALWELRPVLYRLARWWVRRWERGELDQRARAEGSSTRRTPYREMDRGR